MAEQMTAPRFEFVLASEADRENKAIKMVFQSADQKHFVLEISARCAALTMAALAAHLGEILTGLAPEDYPEVQPISVRSAEAVATGGGGVALVMTLEGGAELPLEFSGSNIIKLAAQFAEIAGQGDRGLTN